MLLFVKIHYSFVIFKMPCNEITTSTSYFKLQLFKTFNVPDAFWRVCGDFFVS